MQYRFVVFDWGDTLMRDFPEFTTPMWQWPRVEAVAGAEATLRELHPRASLALATGAAVSDEPGIRRALRRVDLDEYFSKVYCHQNTGHRKPAPEFYEHILRDLRAAPAEVLMVGDSFENDVLGANGVGIRAVWLNPRDRDTRHGALYDTIHSLPELLSLLA